MGPRNEGQLPERGLGILGILRSRGSGAAGFYFTLPPKAPLIFLSPYIIRPNLLNKQTKPANVLCPEKSAMHAGIESVAVMVQIKLIHIPLFAAQVEKCKWFEAM